MTTDQKQSGARHRPGALFAFVLTSLTVHLAAAVVLWSVAERPARLDAPLQIVDVEPIVLVPTSTIGTPRTLAVAKAPPVPGPRLLPTPARPARRATVRRSQEVTRPAPQAPGRPPSPGLSLTMRHPRLDLSLPVSREYVPPPRKRRSRPARRSAEEKSWLIKQRLDRVLAQDASARTVSTGRAHASLYDLLRDAKKSFTPTWAMVDGDSRKRGTMADTSKTILRSMGRSYLRNLKRFMASGGGLPEDRETKEPAMLAGYASVIRAAEKDAGGLQCVLCVTLDHKLKPQITLLRSSGKKVFDAEALQALGRATRLRPLPLDAPSAMACYRFVAKYYRVPPMPTLICTFDESVPTISCLYPGKRMKKKDVILESVKVLGDQG